MQYHLVKYGILGIWSRRLRYRYSKKESEKVKEYVKANEKKTRSVGKVIYKECDDDEKKTNEAFKKKHMSRSRFFLVFF